MTVVPIRKGKNTQGQTDTKKKAMGPRRQRLEHCSWKSRGVQPSEEAEKSKEDLFISFRENGFGTFSFLNCKTKKNLLFCAIQYMEIFSSRHRNLNVTRLSNTCGFNPIHRSVIPGSSVLAWTLPWVLNVPKILPKQQNRESWCPTCTDCGNIFTCGLCLLHTCFSLVFFLA